MSKADKQYVKKTPEKKTPDKNEKQQRSNDHQDGQQGSEDQPQNQQKSLYPQNQPIDQNQGKSNQYSQNNQYDYNQQQYYNQGNNGYYQNNGYQQGQNSNLSSGLQGYDYSQSKQHVPDNRKAQDNKRQGKWNDQPYKGDKWNDQAQKGKNAMGYKQQKKDKESPDASKKKQWAKGTLPKPTQIYVTKSLFEKEKNMPPTTDPRWANMKWQSHGLTEQTQLRLVKLPVFKKGTHNGKEVQEMNIKGRTMIFDYIGAKPLTAKKRFLQEYQEVVRQQEIPTEVIPTLNAIWSGDKKAGKKQSVEDHIQLKRDQEELWEADLPEWQRKHDKWLDYVEPHLNGVLNEEADKPYQVHRDHSKATETKEPEKTTTEEKSVPNGDDQHNIPNGSNLKDQLAKGHQTNNQ